MSLLAWIVLAVMIPLSVWAWRLEPGRAAREEFAQMWRVGPWGKQVLIDFYALELVLALWMLTHASVHESWVLAGVCIAAMPIFGAMPAAVYWLIAVV